MRTVLKFVLAFGLMLAIDQTSLAQSFFIVPQASVGLPVSTARDYATPRLGYGAQVGYRIGNRWSAVAGYDIYRFEVDAPLDQLSGTAATILSLFNLPNVLSLDMNIQAWNAGFRYVLPYSGFIPFIGLSASTNLLEAEGLGLSISRRYWGVAPIIGAELPLTDRWSLQADARVQTIFIRGDIPFIEEVVKEHLVFIPVQIGMVFYIVQ